MATAQRDWATQELQGNVGRKLLYAYDVLHRLTKSAPRFPFVFIGKLFHLQGIMEALTSNHAERGIRFRSVEVAV